MSRESTDQRTAVALAYDGIAAPRVTARVEGEALTQEMLQLAQTHDIPVHRDPRLTALLGRVRLDEEIPLPLFVAVAEILAFAYRLRNRTPPGYASRPQADTDYPATGPETAPAAEDDSSGP